VPGLKEAGVTVREISDMLGVARTYAYKVIRKLVNQGLLIETGYYGDQIRKYSLTSSGEALYLLHVR
jgi:predicted transcriptional regulator